MNDNQEIKLGLTDGDEIVRKDSEVEWSGEGLPPVGAIVLGSFHYDIETAAEWMIDFISESVGVYTVVKTGEQYTFATRDVVLHKRPETLGQKAERERLEAAIYLIDGNPNSQLCMWKDASKEFKEHILWIVDKTGYRK